VGENFKIRLTLLFLGLILGCVLAFVLNIAWYIFTLIVLGYGHSAPEWFIEIDTWIERILIVISVLSCLIASQWFYYYAHKKGRL
jgi:ABC-type antimicrobial peptide transport system permease subunit